MNDRQIEAARQSNEKRVIESGDNSCVECMNNEFVVTYYDSHAPDTQCTRCNYVF